MIQINFILISKRTIEKVFETARVEEIIGDFVQLKKSGSNYKGLSPFTDERTPSFMVSPAKQIWKDFSSGKGGTVITVPPFPLEKSFQICLAGETIKLGVLSSVKGLKPL